EVSDTAPPDAQVLQTEAPAAAPQEAAPVVVTEAEPPPEDAPQLAPTTSIRPQARPARPVPTETPPEDAPDAEADAIAAALAEATTTEDAPQADTGAAAANIPQGPPMSGGEVEGLRIAINRCWVTSTLSTEAMNTTVTLRVEMSEDGKPTAIEMTNFEGGSRSAADRAFEAGRRAVIRCAGSTGYDLPPEKYGQWNVLNLIFDPNGMRLR
ncbi:MAG: cell envelope biogenesis protein TolA, partial [Cypionkella sp.]